MNYKILSEYPNEDLLAKWNDFLANARFPTHYVTPNFFVDPFVRGGERFVVLAFDENEKIAAILSGVDDGRKIVSGLFVRPQTAFRKDADKRQAAGTLLAGLKAKGGERLELIDLHSWEQIDEFKDLDFLGERAEGANTIIMLDLTKGADRIFKEFSQTRRNEIRKFLKQNQVLIAEIENADELAELYAIHRDWNERKGNEPDTFESFKLAFEQKDYRKIFIAKHDGKIIAGSYYRFCAGGVIEYAANNSLVEYQKLRPNDLLGWHSIEWACRAGFAHYSMGGSHLFLRRFGGYELKTYHYRLDRSFLRIHNLKENVRNFGLKTYRNLPLSVKTRIKQFAGKVR